MLEIAPPPRRATRETVEKLVEKISAVTNSTKVDYVNLPEIIAENFQGKPLYKNVDCAEFAKIVHTATGKKIVVNKVVAHLNASEFSQWVKKTLEQEITEIVLVGSASNIVSYPGISVIEANAIAHKLGVIIGNISIPNRENEAQRLVQKTKAGCSFFTTQVLFEVQTMKNVLKEYSSLCASENLKPAAFFLSFAPASDAIDLDYLKWLGGVVPEKTEAQLSKNYKEESVKLAIELYKDMHDYVDANHLNIELALNVEPIASHNLPLAQQILNSNAQH